MAQTYLTYQVTQAYGNFSTEDRLAVFGRKYEMVVKLVNCVGTFAVISHGEIIPQAS